LNTEAKVGTFVIGCLALLGITVYYVGNAQWGHRLTPYRTYLRYAGGVGPGSEVLFGGIAVGRVTAVQAWRQDPTQIEILLEVKEGTPFNEKSLATLGSVSLMSSPAISVTTGSRNARRLNPGDAIPSQETVSIDEMARRLSGIADSATVLITEVQGEIKDIGGQAKTLLANLNDATGQANRDQIAGILRQTNNLLARETPKLDQITDQVLTATQDADSAIKKAGPLMDHTDAAIANVNSTIDQLRNPIQEDLAQLKATMEQAKSLIGSVQAVVRVNDDNVRGTLEDLRVAAENLDQLSDRVKQRPWSLVRIRQPKEREVPQQDK
jgi:phospholipid/cholesterol/gamma-HCH transport system substrate-binding protein